MATVELNNDTWKQFIQAPYAVIDCYGDFCSACVILAPVYDALADELGGIAFGRINVSSDYGIADEYGIEALPTLLYFRNGKMVHKSIGSMDREELLKEMAKMLYE